MSTYWIEDWYRNRRRIQNHTGVKRRDLLLAQRLHSRWCLRSSVSWRTVAVAVVRAAACSNATKPNPSYSFIHNEPRSLAIRIGSHHITITESCRSSCLRNAVYSDTATSFAFCGRELADLLAATSRHLRENRRHSAVRSSGITVVSSLSCPLNELFDTRTFSRF